MPYRGEYASKSAHKDIIQNIDIKNFLNDCDFIHEPNDEIGNELSSTFIEPPTSSYFPDLSISFDGSLYEAPLNKSFPSTLMGYVKIGMVLINLNEYQDLSSGSRDFVDPFKVSELVNKSDGISFPIPSSNIKYSNCESVSESFRLAIYKHFIDRNYAFTNEDDYRLIDTLFDLSKIAISGPNYHNQQNLNPAVKRCPSCLIEANYVFDNIDPIECLTCGKNIYPTDSLRIHELITDYSSNQQALTLFMNVVEKLLLVGFIKMLYQNQPNLLSNICFFMDGPLALFGQPAWLARRIQRFLFQINHDLQIRNFKRFLLIGLQKEGFIIEHANSLKNYIGLNKIKVVDDDYRYRYIRFNPESLTKNFGDETYFGQDFIYKSKKGNIFCFGIPYNSATKESNFKNQKIKYSNYDDLGKIINLIDYFEMDLYQDAVVPIALAHRHASISLKPGGTVLEILSKTELTRN